MQEKCRLPSASYISIQAKGSVGISVCKEDSWSQEYIRNDESFDFLKSIRKITDLLPFLFIKQASESTPGAKGHFQELTSDSVALAGASLRAGLGPTLGAGLGAGSAGAGGAAAAGPLQRALHDGLRPPQVRVAAGAQNRGALSDGAACTSGASDPSHTDRDSWKVRRHLLCWRRQG